MALAVPLPVITPANPGAQLEHEETATLPADVVQTPGGHAEQLDAFAAAYEQGEHMAQPAALSVPPFTTAPANPGEQMLQAATDTLAVAKEAVENPMGHGVQVAAPPDE